MTREARRGKAWHKKSGRSVAPGKIMGAAPAADPPMGEVLRTRGVEAPDHGSPTVVCAGQTDRGIGHSTRRVPFHLVFRDSAEEFQWDRH